MKVRNFIGALAVTGVALAPAAAVAQTAATASTAAKADDGTIKHNIEARLKNSPSLKGSDIDVAVDHGVVTLTGTVHSEAQSTRARTLAKVSGVTNVENKLTVDSKTAKSIDKAEDKAAAAADKTADKSASTAQKAGKKTEKALEKAGIRVDNDKTGPKPNDGVYTTGTSGKPAVKDKDAVDVDAKITDSWITTKIKANFVNEDLLKGSDINVDTNSHVVTLKGTVPSAAGRARAVALAKSTKGVTSVHDALTIAPAK
jgi:osmotically-inducible protein OsmY